MKTLKETKGFAVVYEGRLDTDKMNWGGYAYTIFETEDMALTWLGDKDLKHKIFPVKILPLKKKVK